MGQCAHLQNYVSLPDCQVVALAELRPRLAHRVATRYEIPHLYRDHRAMLDDMPRLQLDGIVVIQPYHRHGLILPEVFAAGVPVLSEKPLARSVQVGEKILAALAASPARHFVAYHKRSDPATVLVKEEIERFRASGELGRLRYLRILMPAGDWIANGDTDLIRTDERVPSLPTDPPPADMDAEMAQRYDAFVNYYIHQVNLMRHLMGEDYELSYADPSGLLMVVRSESGIVGTIEMSPYHTTVDWQEEVLIAFERGYLRLELPAPLARNRPGRVTIYRDPGAGVTPALVSPRLPWVHAMRQQAMYFVQAIRGEPTPLCEASEALRDLYIAREYVRTESCRSRRRCVADSR